MKKYKILLTGKGRTIMDDFFSHTGENFLPVTTSTRYDDIIRHLDFFKPDIFVCCLNGETREDITKLMEHKRRLTREGISTIVIGSEEDCDNFRKIAIYMADLVLYKPISANAIAEQIIQYMENLEKEQEEQKLIQEKLEAIKKQKERKRVLVIDDDPIMLKLIKEHLHDTYDVATAISGKIARKFLESKKVNLILLDYEMPIENGPEVLMKIRENEELANIPVVFLTGITEREKISQALKLKPQGYLLKPIDREKLLGTIERFIL
ncbi:MAG: response regulator [Lachnospiraceae bacterium]